MSPAPVFVPTWDQQQQLGVLSLVPAADRDSFSLASPVINAHVPDLSPLSLLPADSLSPSILIGH